MEGMSFSDTQIDQGLIFQYNRKSWLKSRKMLAQQFTSNGRNINMTMRKISILRWLYRYSHVLKIIDQQKPSLKVIIQVFQIWVLMSTRIRIRWCYFFEFLQKINYFSFLLSSGDKEFLRVLQIQKKRNINIAEIDVRIQNLKNQPNQDNILGTIFKEVINNNITKEEAINQYFILLTVRINSTGHIAKNFCYVSTLYPEVQNIDLEKKLFSIFHNLIIQDHNK
ncbi:unnamed protein product [Paramecium sonneborni]|uniref:Uncharacterized protein n=1 Tax=Paramecium sonneborni TaxID=65129 RepID=A0A8S1L635_9CILI|nr:unnamed protein product [Paramecium sonneborni]